MTIGKLSGQCDFGQKGQSYCNQRGQSCVAKRVKVAWLFQLAKELQITDIKLTTYVSRHTMAMMLQRNDVSREQISQMLGHADMKTTNTYLDSFDTTVIDKAAKVLYDL